MIMRFWHIGTVPYTSPAVNTGLLAATVLADRNHLRQDLHRTYVDLRKIIAGPTIPPLYAGSGSKRALHITATAPAGSPGSRIIGFKRNFLWL